MPGSPSTDPLPTSHPDRDADVVVPVFFLSDSTGISAETMGNALLIQSPDVRFERTLIPFISTVEQAREVVAQLDAAMRARWPRWCSPPLRWTRCARSC